MGPTAADTVIAHRLKGMVSRILMLGNAVLQTRAFFAFLAILLAALWLIRSLLFPGTGGDDSEQLVFAQELSIGYFARNPPLYSWLVVVAQGVFGVSVLSVAVVKFLAIGATCALLYVAGRLMALDERLAVLAGLSPLGLYFVFWDAVTGLTDSALAMALCVASFVVLVKLDRSPRLPWYLAFGAVAGLGLLSKYGYGIFLASLLAAALSDAGLRSRLLCRNGLAALAVLGIVIAPFGVWLAGRAGAAMASDATVPFASGVLHLAKAASGFLLPFWLLLPLFFPSVFTRAVRNPPLLSRYRRIIGVQLIAALVIFVVVIAVSGLRAREYYMFVLILVPLYFFSLVQTREQRPDEAARYAFAVALVSVGAVLALTVKAVAEPLWCEDCERHLPYAAWAERLRAAGFTGGTIVADYYPFPLAGNFGVQFPASRIVSVKHPAVVAPPRGGGGCLLLWADEGRRPAVIGVANAALGAAIDPAAEGGSLHAPIRLSGREQPLHYLFISEGAGECR